jgi:hypothetical protein
MFPRTVKFKRESRAPGENIPVTKEDVASRDEGRPADGGTGYRDACSGSCTRIMAKCFVRHLSPDLVTSKHSQSFARVP